MASAIGMSTLPMRRPGAAGLRLGAASSSSSALAPAPLLLAHRRAAPARFHRRLPPAQSAPRNFSPFESYGEENSPANSRAASPEDERLRPTQTQPPAASPSSSSTESLAARRRRQQSAEPAWLGLPLRLASTMAHVNRQYIRTRRRRKWWNKYGGYPRVPSDQIEALPELAVELWQKVLPLGLIFFCASFNLTLLQNLKDAIMVTAGGAEVLPYLASFCVLPASVAFFVLYGRMVSALPERAVFYAAVTPLLVFYALFAAVIAPAAPALHPLDAAARVMDALPAGLHGLVKVAANWTYSLFFCMAELWGSVVISVLFWSLANEVCTVDEAKAVYPFMAIGANVALVAAGMFIRAVTAVLPAAGAAADGGNLATLRVLVGTVLVMSVAMFACKAYIDARVLPAADAADAGTTTTSGGKAAPRKKKARGSMADSLGVLRRSSKIRNLALLVMSYGVGHRLFEFAWKGQLRVLYPSVQAYSGVLADVATYTGVATLASMFVSRLIFQHLGWGVAAAVTPALMGVAGAVFFGSCLLAGGVGTALLPASVTTAAVAAGAAAGVVTQVVARSSKYSLFDPAKEMVYIEMDKDEKQQGKAAVDLLGSQIGKSGASWITQAFLIAAGSMAGALPFISVCFIGVIGVWLHATFGLHHQMEATEAQRAVDAAAAAAAADEQAAAAGGARAVESTYESVDSIDGSELEALEGNSNGTGGGGGVYNSNGVLVASTGAATAA